MTRRRTKVIRTAVALLFANLVISSGMSHARADITIFYEDFSSLSGDLLFPGPSERGSGDYLLNITLPGWTMEGDPSQIYGFDRSGDKALLLNEGSGDDAFQAISRTLTGLVPGVEHTLSFEYWGDNVADSYSFTFEINGTITPISATHSGLETGEFHTRVFRFTPTSSSTTLRFTETLETPSGPMIDNILLTAASVSQPPKSKGAVVLNGFGCVIPGGDWSGDADLATSKSHQVTTPSGVTQHTCTFNIPKGLEPDKAVSIEGFTCDIIDKNGNVVATTTDSRSVSTPGGKVILTCFVRREKKK